MGEPAVPARLLAALRAGGEALDRGERGPSVELALLRDAGLLAAPLPVADGGRGLGSSATGAAAICEVLMALGGASLPIARLYEGHVNATALIVRHGNAEQRVRIGEQVRQGAMLGVWGADGEQPVLIEQTAAGPTLCGTKAFASGLGDISIAIVAARGDHGLQMVMVAANDPARADHTAWDVDGMVGSRSGWFDCTGLPAGGSALLGGPDAFFEEPDFHGGVWRLAACYAGAMARLATLCADWTERREQSAVPIVQSRVGMGAIEAETATLWARHAATVVERRDGRAGNAVATALFAREAVEQAATRQLALVERLSGTAMHRRGSESGRIARDLRFYLRQGDLDGKLALATAHWMALSDQRGS